MLAAARIGRPRLAEGKDLIAEAIGEGRGCIVLAEAGSPEAAAFLACAAAAGRAGEGRVVDLSGPTARQGLLSRHGRVAPDLDALLHTDFAEHALTAMALAKVAGASPFPRPYDEGAEARSSALAEARAGLAPGPGAWDRAMGDIAVPGADGRPIGPSLLRERLLKDEAWPGLDGVTPALDLDDALGCGLTLVLVEGQHLARREAGSLERIALATRGLAWFLGSSLRAGGARLVASRWASQVMLHADPANAPEGLVPPGASRIANASFAFMPPEGTPPPSSPVPFSSPFPLCTGTVSPGSRDPIAVTGILSVDRTGWPTYTTGRLPRPGDEGPALAGIASLAVDRCEPLGFRLDVPSHVPHALSRLRGGPARDDDPDPYDDAPHRATCHAGGFASAPVSLPPGVDVTLALACEDAGGGSLLHAWVLAGDAVRRRQFVLSWGGLADLGRIHGLGPMVDAGGRTLPAMAGILGLDEARTRRLVRFPVAAPVRVRRFHGLLAAMRPDRLPGPGDGPGWLAFVDLAHLVLKMVAVDLPTAAAYLDRTGRRGWGRAMACGAGSREVGDLLNGIASLVDEAVGRDEERESYPTAISMLLDAGDGAAIRRMSEAWHADPVLRRGSSLDLPGDTAWPVPRDGVEDLGGGHTGRFLGSLPDLVEEGSDEPDRQGVRGLSHCVASYAKACLDGDCAIVSIRDAEGRRVSTAELAMGPPIRVVQHRALGNAEPPKAAAAALGRMVERLDAAPPGTLRRIERPAEPPSAEMAGELRRQMLEDLAQRWSRILPRRWRRRGFEELASAIAARREALGRPA